EIARVLLRVFGLIGDVAFRDEEIDEAIVVDVLELVMPGRRRSGVPAGEWLRRVDATLESDVAVRRMRWTGRECLQAVITSARKEDLGVTVAGEVVTGDAHALNLHVHPTIVGRVQRGRLTWRDAPQLLLTVRRQVVVRVVAHAKIHAPGAIPVAEEHRQRTPARTKPDRRPIPEPFCARPEQLGVEAEVV